MTQSNRVNTSNVYLKLHAIHRSGKHDWHCDHCTSWCRCITGSQRTPASGRTFGFCDVFNSPFYLHMRKPIILGKTRYGSVFHCGKNKTSTSLKCTRAPVKCVSATFTFSFDNGWRWAEMMILVDLDAPRLPCPKRHFQAVLWTSKQI